MIPAYSAICAVRTEREIAEAAFRLESEYGVMTRCGLHCAPRAHQTLGTYPQGTVRLVPGHTTTPEEIRDALTAVAAVAAGGEA